VEAGNPGFESRITVPPSIGPLPFEKKPNELMRTFVRDPEGNRCVERIPVLGSTPTVSAVGARNALTLIGLRPL